MLQRIQSVWLFLSTTMIFALFMFPYVQVMSAGGTAKAIKVTGVYENIGGQVVQTSGFLLLTIAAVLLALLPFIVIFLFKNRKLQISLSYVVIVLILGFSFWFAQTAKSALGGINLELQNYGLGVVFPCLAVLFIILAVRAMRKDEQLIRSANRLR